jgi:aspartate kinase
MNVFKFGGASVKDAEGVRNVARVLGQFPDDDLLIVVSAMGKTTNALEEVVHAHQDGRDARALIAPLRAAHADALHAVAPDDPASAKQLAASFSELEQHVQQTAAWPYEQDYDHIVAFGELWSTLVVAAHLNAAGIATAWLDAREVVATDGLHRAAHVDWERSAKQAAHTLKPLLGRSPVRVLTQGFIGRSSSGSTTTLGREGSDFSAAIFAWLLDAASVTIWKDVPGMFNADPNKFPHTTLLRHISYKEAIELSYFGASVIHPRTLQPLQQKSIPLHVRSFLQLDAPGTVIDHFSGNDSLVPSFIHKPGQVLLSITPRDLSFVAEDRLSAIFGAFARHGVPINMMQNSAVAFTVCVDNGHRVKPLVLQLREDFEVRWNEGLELLTVRHPDELTLTDLTRGREILLEQRSRATARYVLR